MGSTHVIGPTILESPTEVIHHTLVRKHKNLLLLHYHQYKINELFLACCVLFQLFLMKKLVKDKQLRLYGIFIIDERGGGSALTVDFRSIKEKTEKIEEK